MHFEDTQVSPTVTAIMITLSHKHCINFICHTAYIFCVTDFCVVINAKRVPVIMVRRVLGLRIQGTAFRYGR